MPAGSANTSALFGAVDREADEDAHQRLAGDQARREQRADAIALLDFVFRQVLAEACASRGELSRPPRKIGTMVSSGR